MCIEITGNDEWHTIIRNLFDMGDAAQYIPFGPPEAGCELLHIIFVSACFDIFIGENRLQFPPILVSVGNRSVRMHTKQIKRLIVRKYDSGKQMWEFIAELEQERKELAEEAAEKKQKEKLEEKRMEAKREEERIAQKKIKERKGDVNLAAKATEYKKQLATSYFDRIDAEIQHGLIEIELKELQKKTEAKPLV